MGKKLYPADTLKQAQSLLAAWDQIDPSLAIGPVTSAALLTEVDSARTLKEEITRLQIKLLDLRNQRDDLCLGIWDKVKRTRSGIKGFYGDDSTEYESAGGTRSSDRKPHRRKRSTETTPSRPIGHLLQIRNGTLEQLSNVQTLTTRTAEYAAHRKDRFHQYCCTSYSVQALF